MNKSHQSAKRPQQKKQSKLTKQTKQQQKRTLTTKRVSKPSVRSATASPILSQTSPFSTLFKKSTPTLLAPSATKTKLVSKILPKFKFAPLTSGMSLFSTANQNYQQDGKEVEQRIFQVLNSFDKVNKEKLSSTAHLQNDLGLDSLDRVEVVLAVEEEFNMEFSDEQSDKFATVNEIVDFVARQPNIHLRTYKPDDI